MSTNSETRPYLRCGWPARGGTIRVMALLPRSVHRWTDEAKAAGDATGTADRDEQERRLMKLGWTYDRIHHWSDMLMPAIVSAVPRDETWRRRSTFPLLARFATQAAAERWFPLDWTYRRRAATSASDLWVGRIDEVAPGAEQVKIEGGPPCYEFWNKHRRWLLTGASAVRIYDAFYRRD